MPSLAQRLRDEGKEYWYNQWRKEELEPALKKDTERIALSCLLQGLDVDVVAKVTELPKETVEKLRQTPGNL